MKRAPEALLEELSQSLQSYEAVVSSWDQPPPESKKTAISVAVGEGKRPPRLGLGAKPNRHGDLDSLSANLKLKQQLTNTPANNAPGTLRARFESKASASASTVNHRTGSMPEKHKALAKKKQKLEEDVDEPGKAALVKNKK
jgi:hypothetical protein